MKKIILFCTILLGCGQLAYGQLNPKTETIAWEVNSLYDVSYDSLSSYESSFITYDESKILWVQHGGQFIIEFKVQSARGTWADANSDGLLQYRTSLDGKGGTLTFERKNGQVSIAMNFEADGRNEFPFVFNVSAVNKKL
jgi:hypothetical protein